MADLVGHPFPDHVQLALKRQFIDQALGPPDEDLADGKLYPGLARLRPISRSIARAVALAACESGVATAITPDEIDKALDHEIWDLDYPTLKPI